MKKLLILLLIVGFNLSAKEVILKIKHHIDGKEVVLNDSIYNINSFDTKIQRLQYYLTNFQLIDGNNNEINDLEKYVIIDINTSEYSLGNISVDNISKIKYYFGIEKEVNNGDPSVWPEGHPLSLQNSFEAQMHWGWSAGYRFIAIEGVTKDIFNRWNNVFQFHLVGNQYYSQLQQDISPTEKDGKIYIEFNVNLLDILYNVDIIKDNFIHGSGGSNDVIASNIKNGRVFKSESTTADVKDLYPELKITPNPANDFINLITGSTNISTFEFKIFNSNGEFISDYFPNKSSNLNISSFATGVYYLQITNDKTIIKTIKFIKN